MKIELMITKILGNLYATPKTPVDSKPKKIVIKYLFHAFVNHQLIVFGIKGREYRVSFFSSLREK